MIYWPLIVLQPARSPPTAYELMNHPFSERSLRNAAASARLLQAKGLHSKSAAHLATSLANALEELHRLSVASIRRIREISYSWTRIRFSPPDRGAPTR
jgi:hypothetical protein